VDAAAGACGCSPPTTTCALGFYQRRGLRLCALHAGAVERDRALKPEIPEVNPDNGIPLRDLLELELPLRVPGGAVVVRTPGR
jgi:hypothetical protein